MGLFLSMSGVIGGNHAEARTALQRFAASRQGRFAEDPSPPDDEALVIREGAGGVSILYPDGFLGWEDAAQFLSTETGKPVFSFHIHDSDLWMYSLYENGRVVDQFNPIPDYWQEIDAEERQAWRGDAEEVARRVPGLQPAAVSRYLVHWGVEVFGAGARRKAYPDDRFFYGDDWQLMDFIKRLGLDFPLDHRGSRIGTVYSFRCGSS